MASIANLLPGSEYVEKIPVRSARYQNCDILTIAQDIVDIKANGAVQKGTCFACSFIFGLPYLDSLHFACYVKHQLTFPRNATQGLPRKDWSRLQRHKERGWCHHLQEGQAPLHREASQPPNRARFQVTIKRRVRPPSQEKRRVKEEIEDRWYTCSLEETTFDATRGPDHLDEGQRTRDHRTNRLRDDYLNNRIAGFLGFCGGLGRFSWPRA